MSTIDEWIEYSRKKAREFGRFGDTRSMYYWQGCANGLLEWKKERETGEQKDMPEPLFTIKPEFYDRGVAGFASVALAIPGHCHRCQKAGMVYTGFNGGVIKGTFCDDCKGPVLRKEK